jgi:hypothetical protein
MVARQQQRGFHDVPRRAWRRTHYGGLAAGQQIQQAALAAIWAPRDHNAQAGADKVGARERGRVAPQVAREIAQI